MKKGMRERVSGGDVCDCCFGEQLTAMIRSKKFNLF